MKLETFNKPLPLFTTWTFNAENYEDNPKYVLIQIQKLFRSLRDSGHKIRYFNVIERGSAKKRLHGHSIIWSPTLQSLPRHDIFKLLWERWNRGAVDVQLCRSGGAIHYVTKYVTKDLHENICHDTGLVRSCRNYQWSQKPMLGMSGRIHWENTIDHYHKQRPFNNHNLPPNHISFPIGNKIDKVFIPKQYWIDKAKQLGLSFTPEVENMTDIELDQLIIKNGQTQKNKIFIPERQIQRL